MKASVSIRIEFDPADGESCGEFRDVSTQFTGNWNSLPNAVGQALSMIHPPRPIDVVARLVEELGLERPENSLSSRFADCASKIISAYESLDKLRDSNASSEEIIAAMNII